MTWAVSRGIILGSGGDGWLRSEKTHADFLLRLEFRNSPKGNSGVFLRASKAELLGFKGKLQWSQDTAGLKVTLPARNPATTRSR